MRTKNHPQEINHLTHPKYRPDIDGLRAIAVLSVICFHAFPALHSKLFPSLYIGGGFVGVDIFFVISGFLISTIIFDNLEKGSFSFVEFYSRRIKRIFPALLLVLISCFAFGWFALLADEYKQLGKHIAAGAGFVSNFVLWNESGYFDTITETKPLLHLWTLGIEEQFYIIWPLLLWGAWKRKLNLLWLTLGLATLSFVLNMLGVRTDPTATFYSPQTRFWELLIGSTLAYVTLYKPHFWLTSPAKFNTLRHIQSIIGFALIVIAILFIKKEHEFPGALALLPTLGAVFIISAGPQAVVNRFILSQRVLVWFGLISFPLYLWHWPLLSFARIVESETPAINIRIAAVVITIALAWLTYRFIEKPIRFGQSGHAKTLALAMMMVVVGGVGYLTYIKDGLTFRRASLIHLTSQFGFNGQQRDMLCISTYGPAEFCRLSRNSSPTILLIGDSKAWQLYSGLASFAKDSNETVLALNQGRCSGFFGFYNQKDYEACQSVTHKALEIALHSDSVKTVIFSSHPYYYSNNSRQLDVGFGKITEEYFTSQDVFDQRMKTTLNNIAEQLLAHGKTVIFVINNSNISFDPRACVSRPLSVPKKEICADSIANYKSNIPERYMKVIDEVIAQHPKIKVYDLSKQLCDNNLCWVMRNDTMLYSDLHGHLSIQGSIEVGRNLFDLIPKK